MRIVKSISLMMLVLISLLSSSGLRISQHWCGDMLMNASIWDLAEPCAHASSKEVSCPFHQKLPENNCCNERETVIDEVESDQELLHYTLQFSNENLFHPVLYVFNIQPISAEISKTNVFKSFATID